MLVNATFSFHFQYEEVDAEQLQKILNDVILKGLDCKTLESKIIMKPCDTAMFLDLAKLNVLIFFSFSSGDLKSGGFSIDACRSMIALMDVSSSLKFVMNCSQR